MTKLFHGLSIRHQSDVRLRRLDQILLRGSFHHYPCDSRLIRSSYFHPQMWALQSAIPILLQLETLGSKNIAPDVTGKHPEMSRHSVLTFFSLLDELDAGQYIASVVEGLEAEHGGCSELDASVILLDFVVQIL